MRNLSLLVVSLIVVMLFTSLAEAGLFRRHKARVAQAQSAVSACQPAQGGQTCPSAQTCPAAQSCPAAAATKAPVACIPEDVVEATGRRGLFKKKTAPAPVLAAPSCSGGACSRRR